MRQRGREEEGGGLPANQGLFAPSHWRGLDALALAGKLMSCVGDRYWTACACPARTTHVCRRIVRDDIFTLLSRASSSCPTMFAKRREA